MASLVARIELPDKKSDHPDYEKLHQLMENVRFTREIQVPERQGESFNLPHATYVSSAYSVITTAVNAIKQATKDVDSKPARIIVFQYVDHIAEDLARSPGLAPRLKDLKSRLEELNRS